MPACRNRAQAKGDPDHGQRDAEEQISPSRGQAHITGSEAESSYRDQGRKQQEWDGDRGVCRFDRYQRRHAGGSQVGRPSVTKSRGEDHKPEDHGTCELQDRHRYSKTDIA